MLAKLLAESYEMSDSDSPADCSGVISVCGIGASAGGLEALRAFFNALPNDLGLAYVIVVHLAPHRKSDLPSIMQRCTMMPVIQVGDHDKLKLEENHVYVIAPDCMLEITDTSIGASRFAQARGQRAAIDLFFRSLAASHGDGFAVVLSGSGSDGALGARAVREDTVRRIKRSVMVGGHILTPPWQMRSVGSLCRGTDRRAELTDDRRMRVANWPHFEGATVKARSSAFWAPR